MTGSASQRILLLPERRRFAGQPLSPGAATMLGRADRSDAAEPGEKAQLLRYFDLLPHGWPMAALTRQLDAGDAGSQAWLRADPVHVRPDMTGVRLLAWGNLALEPDEAESFLQALRPLFGDAGLPISAPIHERWYLQVAAGSVVPEFPTPAEGLGQDLLPMLPQGPDGRRWRALLNEAQVILHNHPRNIQRVSLGKLPVNSLWFWGFGMLPQRVSTPLSQVTSHDAELLALAAAAGIPAADAQAGSQLVDLRDERRWIAIERDHLLASPRAPMAGGLMLDFADGVSFRIRPGQRLRFWRRPLASLGG